MCFNRWMIALMLMLVSAGWAAEETATEPVINTVLDLETAQRRALEDNPTLRASQARVLQAQERVKQARSLYFPMLTASYSATHTDLPERSLDDARNGIYSQAVSGIVQGTLGGVLQTGTLNVNSLVGNTALSLWGASQAANAIDDSINQYNGSITASYILFDGFNRRFTHAIARHGKKETEAGQHEAQRLILSAVAQSYYGVQLASENVKIANADHAFNMRLLKDALARQKQGAGSLSDVLNFEVRQRGAEAVLIIAEQNYDSSRIALATLMGIPEGQLPDTVVVAPLQDETPEAMADQVDDEWIARALAQRPDVALRKHGLERAQASVGQRKSAYYPSVNAFASQDYQRSNDSTLTDKDAATTVGVNVGYTLFAGGRNRAAVHEAKHYRTESEWLLEDAELTAQADVRNALLQLSASQKQLLLQRTTADYVEQNRTLVEKEYNAGQTDLTRLNQAQRDLVEAQSRLASARVALQAAWHDLRTASADTLHLVEEQD